MMWHAFRVECEDGDYIGSLGHFTTARAAAQHFFSVKAFGRRGYDCL